MNNKVNCVFYLTRSINLYIIIESSYVEVNQVLRKWLQEEANQIISLLERKNRDYGSGNLIRAGEIGIVVRLMDKIARLENFYFKENNLTVTDESIDDTVRDIAGYCLMFFLLKKGLLKKLNTSMEETDDEI
jgi:hypothetical protein